jgi:hypothetical protein
MIEAQNGDCSRPLDVLRASFDPFNRAWSEDRRGTQQTTQMGPAPRGFLGEKS